MLFDIRYVKAGMKVELDVKDPHSGMTLITHGSELTESLIEKLKTRGIEELEISLTEEEKALYELDYDVLPTVDIRTSNMAKAALEEMKLKNRFQGENIKKVMENAERIAQKICSENSFTYSLNQYKIRKEPSDHSVRVATYAVTLAKRYNEVVPQDQRIDLNKIATAALVHDLGKLCETDEIREKLVDYIPLTEKFMVLTPELRSVLKTVYDPNYVPYYTYNLLYNCQDLKSDGSNIRMMALYSHEDELGNGPFKVDMTNNPNDRIKPSIVGAKMISLCSMFDDVLTQNIREGQTLENCMAALMQLMMDKVFSKDLITLFIESIPLYPVGTKVQIASPYNDEPIYGIVTDNHSDVIEYFINKGTRFTGDRTSRLFYYYNRPAVKIFRKDEPYEKIIDLADQDFSNITITNIIGDEMKFSTLYKEELEAKRKL